MSNQTETKQVAARSFGRINKSAAPHYCLELSELPETFEGKRMFVIPLLVGGVIVMTTTPPDGVLPPEVRIRDYAVRIQLGIDLGLDMFSGQTTFDTELPVTVQWSPTPGGGLVAIVDASRLILLS